MVSGEGPAIQEDDLGFDITHCGTTAQPKHASSCVASVGQTRRETMQTSGDI